MFLLEEIKKGNNANRKKYYKSVWHFLKSVRVHAHEISRVKLLFTLIGEERPFQSRPDDGRFTRLALKQGLSPTFSLSLCFCQERSWVWWMTCSQAWAPHAWSQEEKAENILTRLSTRSSSSAWNRTASISKTTSSVLPYTFWKGMPVAYDLKQIYIIIAFLSSTEQQTTCYRIYIVRLADM